MTDKRLCTILAIWRCNEDTISYAEATEIEYEEFYLPSRGDMDMYALIYKKIMPKYYMWPRVDPHDWIIKENKKFLGTAAECDRLYTLLWVVKEVCNPFYHGFSSLHEMVVMHRSKSTSGISAMARFEKYMPAVTYMIEHTELKRHEQYLYLIRAPQSSLIRSQIADCHFFGFGTIQSYEKAIEFGIPRELCKVGEHADIHLIVPIRLMYQYFVSPRFILSLRLVCKNWNNSIKKAGVFWTQYLPKPHNVKLEDVCSAVRIRGMSRELQKLYEKQHILEKNVQAAESARSDGFKRIEKILLLLQN